MSLVQTCWTCKRELALSEFYAHRKIYRWEKRLYIRHTCISCYKAKENLRYAVKKIRLEAEEEAREYKRKLLKWFIKVLIWLVIVGWIVAVVAKS